MYPCIYIYGTYIITGLYTVGYKKVMFRNCNYAIILLPKHCNNKLQEFIITVCSMKTA